LFSRQSLFVLIVPSLEFLFSPLPSRDPPPECLPTQTRGFRDGEVTQCHTRPRDDALICRRLYPRFLSLPLVACPTALFSLGLGSVTQPFGVVLRVSLTPPSARRSLFPSQSARPVPDYSRTTGSFFFDSYGSCSRRPKLSPLFTSSLVGSLSTVLASDRKGSSLV